MLLYLIKFKNQATATYFSGTSVQRDRECWYFTDNIDHAIRTGDKATAEHIRNNMPMKDSLVVVEHQFGDGK
jgi:hypothetical protein